MAESKFLPFDVDKTTVVIVGAATTTVLAIGTTYWKIKKRYRFWSERDVPGPPPTFFLGNYGDTSKESHLVVHKRWIQRYGRVFGTFDLLQPKLIVSDPDLVKQMLVKDFYLLPDRRIEFVDHPIEKKFSMFAEGEYWKKTRSVLTPAFSSAKFKTIFTHMDTCSDRLVEHLNNLISRSEATNVEAMEVFKNYSSDTISRCIFSVSFLESYDSPDKIIDSILAYFDASRYKMFLSLILPTWFKTLIRFSIYNVRSLNYSWSLFGSFLKQRAKQNNNEIPTDMLKLMMDGAAQVNWGDEDILSNLVILYVTGSHTSTLTLSAVAYIFAKYPHVQENIVRELNDFLAEGKEVTLDAVTNRFKYLHSVVSEVLRLYPPSTYNERRVAAEVYSFEHEGKVIRLPKESIVYFPTFVIHRDPEYFVEPDKFDDTRFMPENKEAIHPYAYAPFGHGPRNCPGTRFALTAIKLAILKIAPKFKFKLADPTVDPMADLSDTFDELLISKPIRLDVTKA